MTEFINKHGMYLGLNLADYSCYAAAWVKDSAKRWTWIWWIEFKLLQGK